MTQQFKYFQILPDSQAPHLSFPGTQSSSVHVQLGLLGCETNLEGPLFVVLTSSSRRPNAKRNFVVADTPDTATNAAAAATLIVSC